MNRINWWGLLVACLWTAQAWAGQVCLEKGTGKLLEYQSGGLPGTCTANAQSAGHPANQIEERTVTETEWAAIYEEQVAAPQRAQDVQVRADQQATADVLRQKLGLSAKEFDELKDALR